MMGCPWARLNDPDCPMDSWWSLAERYPVEAIESDLYPLVILENPGRWLALEEKFAQQWFNDLVNEKMRRHLNPTSSPDPSTNRANRLLSIDIAKRVLHIVEAAFPGKQSPQIAIETATLFAFGLTTEQSLTLARNAAFSAADSTSSAGAAATSAGNSAVASADRAADFTAYSAAMTGKRSDSFVWAWRRVLEFLLAPDQLPPPWDTYERRHNGLP